MRSWDHGEVIQLTKLHYDPINTTPKTFLRGGEKIRLNTTLTQRPLANIHPLRSMPEHIYTKLNVTFNFQNNI
jgi:hypothetical protein